MGFPGGTELIIIILVVVLLFGGKKIPELMRGLGTGIKEFKKAQSDVKNEINRAVKEEPSDTKSEK